MERKLEKGDIPILEEVLSKCLGKKAEIISARRMGSLTNRTYKVKTPQASYAVRIPGEGTEEMIDREAERISTKLACKLELDAPLLYFGEDGEKVTAYLRHAQTMDEQTMQCPENIRRAAQLLHRLHDCGQDTGVPFEVFDLAACYEREATAHQVPMYSDYKQMKEAVLAIKQKVDRICLPQPCPCHNDPLPANWVMSEGRMYLVDWEYAGMNDPMWDLADLSVEAGYGSVQDELLLRFYLDGEVTERVRRQFAANKIYLDYLWSIWGKARVPYDGQPIEEYAWQRYNRMKQNIENYTLLFCGAV